jgi:hypothetical protein
VTLQHKTRLKSQILESEILDLYESVLQELSTNIFDIIILLYFKSGLWVHVHVFSY